jgi:hypothetical protein
MDIKIIIGLFTGISFMIPNSCEPPVDYYQQAITDGVCQKEEYSSECTDYLRSLIPFDSSWDQATEIQKNTIAKAYYAALFAPFGDVSTMAEGTALQKGHLYDLGQDGPARDNNRNRVIFNRLMNTIKTLSYDNSYREDLQLARYEFVPGEHVVVNSYFFEFTSADEWFMHLSILLHETEHARGTAHIPCLWESKDTWCDIDVSGAYGFESVILSMMLKAETPPSSQFFLTESMRERIYHTMVMKLSHVIQK